jgi:peptidyl-prolyl cis-trans isomerase C
LTSPTRRYIFAISANAKIITCWLTFGFLSLATNHAYGLQEFEAAESVSPKILATINGQAITRDQVTRDLLRTVGDRQLSAIENEKAIELTIQKLINQHIAIDFLSNRGLAANPSEVDFQIENLKSELKRMDLSFTEFLKETYQTSDELRFQTKWQLSWERYLKNKLTDEFLKSYFERSKRRFNGTEIKAAHLLIKLPANNSQAQEERTNQQLLEIRKQVLAKTVSWQEAVKEHSEAPTRLSGGSIGWIAREGPMAPSFTNAAFQLSENEISLPVKTKFGFHLIRCEAIRDSALGWKDVRTELEKNAARDLLQAIVKQHEIQKAN